MISRKAALAQWARPTSYSWHVTIQHEHSMEYGLIRAACSLEEARIRAHIAGGQIIGIEREDIRWPEDL
jgi:hypothetical protein